MKSVTALTAWLLSATLGLLLVSCGTATVKKTEGPKEAAKKCLECHPEFSERFSKGVVHAPVKEGDCYACHRPHGIFGKVIFRADQPALCYTCHPAVQPKETAKSVHKPLATEQCSTCHNPHNSDFAGLLAAEAKESCFTCHDRAEFQQQFVHAPLNQGCGTCHIPHSSENVSLLQQAPERAFRLEAGEQHRRVHVLDALEKSVQVPHRGRGADHVLDADTLPRPSRSRGSLESGLLVRLDPLVDAPASPPGGGSLAPPSTPPWQACLPSPEEIRAAGGLIEARRDFERRCLRACDGPGDPHGLPFGSGGRPCRNGHDDCLGRCRIH